MEDSALLTYSSDGDSDEDVITNYLEGGRATSPGMAGLGGNGPLVPIISVTPHSPGSKHYPILDENLAHLHDIHDSIQQMRHATAAGLTATLRLAHARLSCSCPSLNDPGSDPDLVSSLTSSPSQGGRNSTWLPARTVDSDLSRRRSWTALEDLTGRGKMCYRQRSVSLSSMESEPEDPFSEHGSTAHLLSSGIPTAVSRRGGASTHSLNEADLQNDFQVIVAKQAERQRLLPVRLPLQKSISTPSIIAARDLVVEPAVTKDKDALAVFVPFSLRPSGTESETEEDVSQFSVNAISTGQIHLHQFLESYDTQSEKRRKRGSLFFRKKKDKVKKSAHQWAAHTTVNSITCDWCGKPLANKPAVYCEVCLRTVHATSCKEQLSDCSKSKLSKSSMKAAPVNKRTSGQQTARKTMLCYSPWKRVATKLGVNQSANEEYQNGHHSEGSRYMEESFPPELLDDMPVSVKDLDTDPLLGLGDDEPECWSPTVSKEILRRLKDKEVKRQEHIYEFILTEKHHCLTLRVMQKVFVEGFRRHFQLGANLDRMFPRLAELTDIHFRFLGQLRLRQRTAPVVETLADILLEQFSGSAAERLKAAYGEFCSHHRNAVDIYKYYTDHDRRFGEFVRHCQQNPLLKKKGIPECILFVTQRLTKYPLLIEPLIKAAKDNKPEQERLQRALSLVKDILVAVNAQVAEKEKEDRKLEIYNRIDAKSFTIHRGVKFKKSDILSDNRQLRFEGTAMLMQCRGKMTFVLVVLLSDVLFFLQENNNKYTFFTPENKAGVVSVQKLLVREKAGQDSKGIYLISSHPAEPEMFELKVHKPKDKAAWIHGIRSAVERCPEEDDDTKLSSEEKHRLWEAKQSHIRQIVDILRQKDLEQALILEEKMALQLKLLAAAGLSNVPDPPDYCHLVAEEADTGVMWKKVISAVQEVSQLASSLYASGTNLSRSASSVGERQSDAYVSPTLPKRAETFGGFDNPQLPGNKLAAILKKHKESASSGTATPDKHLMDQFSWRDAVMSALPPDMVGASSGPPGEVPALLTLGREQQLAAVQLSHYVYTLLCIIWQQMTSIDSLQAQLAACKSQLNSDDRERRPAYRHNHQLEELRNIQDRLSQEKEAWQREKDAEEKDLEERRLKLLALQNQVREEQKDIADQREQLYRKLELLTSQGVLLSASLPAAPSTPVEEDLLPTTPTSTEPRRKADSHKWKSGQSKANTLPPNLMSTTNQHKVPINLQVKQQLPLKLAATSKPPAPTSASSVQQMLPMKLRETGAEGRRSAGGYARLSSETAAEVQTPQHTRTGSSPAMMENAPCPKPEEKQPIARGIVNFTVNKRIIKLLSDDDLREEYV